MISIIRIFLLNRFILHDKMDEKDIQVFSPFACPVIIKQHAGTFHFRGEECFLFLIRQRLKDNVLLLPMLYH